MAVTLEGTVKRWIGLSGDTKPEPGQIGASGVELTRKDVPAGSSFFESDTGNIYRWNGSAWLTGEAPQLRELRAIQALLIEIRDRLPDPSGL